jgi:hypothetical protein
MGNQHYIQFFVPLMKYCEFFFTGHFCTLCKLFTQIWERRDYIIQWKYVGFGSSRAVSWGERLQIHARAEHRQDHTRVSGIQFSTHQTEATGL